MPASAPMPVFTPYPGAPPRSTSLAAVQRFRPPLSRSGPIRTACPEATSRISAGSRSSAVASMRALPVMSVVAQHGAGLRCLRPAEDERAHGDVQDGQAPVPEQDPLVGPFPARPLPGHDLAEFGVQGLRREPPAVDVRAQGAEPPGPGLPPAAHAQR